MLTAVDEPAESDGPSETLVRTRLVTLTGPGGVGKTRLALALAHRQIGRRADGVWLVDLTSGPQTPDVAAETARMLDVRSPVGTAPSDALCSYLADRDLLLVLDKCDGVRVCDIVVDATICRRRPPSNGCTSDCCSAIRWRRR
jgi:predicted ATPase